MAGLARSIQLFNAAYKLAWAQVSQPERMKHPEIARTLSSAIHDQIKVGATDAATIAAEAVKSLKLT